MFQIAYELKAPDKTMHHNDTGATTTVFSSTRNATEVDIEVMRKEVKSDTLLSKYNKMVSVGVPAGSTVNKMKKDGIRGEEKESFENA